MKLLEILQPAMVVLPECERPMKAVRAPRFFLRRPFPSGIASSTWLAARQRASACLFSVIRG